MRIVVTGALGHIGSRLIRDLPANCPEAEVIMLDNLATQRYCSLFNLPDGGRYRFSESDLLEANLERLFQGADVIVHLAAITDATSSIKNRAEVERVNLSLTERIARASATLGCRLVQISSTSVYGPRVTTVDETCDAEDLRPQTPYAATKLREESLVREMAAKHNLRYVTFRFGTIYGVSPGMRFHTAVNKFCWQAVMGQPLTVWQSALNQVRPYLDLSMAVKAILFAIQQKLFDGQIYNAVSDNRDVRSIVETIQRYIPRAKIKLVHSDVMNDLSFSVGTTRLENKGLKLRGNLNDGIAETINLLKAVAAQHD